jgi:hypothetical protein
MSSTAQTAAATACSVSRMPIYPPDPILVSRPAAAGWTTSSFGHAASASAAELSALGEHLRTCGGASGRLFALQCGGEAVHRFVSGRIVTTFLGAIVVIGIAALALPAG